MSRNIVGSITVFTFLTAPVGTNPLFSLILFSTKKKLLRGNFIKGPEFGKVECNPKAVGRDSGVPFSLSNFLEDILQPTSSKMSQTSN